VCRAVAATELRLRLVLSLGQGIPHCAAFPATARVAAYRPTLPTGMDVGFHDGTVLSTQAKTSPPAARGFRQGVSFQAPSTGATAVSAPGTGAVDLETKPSHGPDGCDLVTSPVAPPRRSSSAPTRGHESACRRPDDGPPESAYGPDMGIVSPGYFGRGRSTPDLPPGQYLSEDFPVLPPADARVDVDDRRFTVTSETGAVHEWDWSAFRALATESPTVDLHCLTRWSKLATSSEGVWLDRPLAEVGTGADYASVDSWPIHNEPALEDLLDGKAWVAFRYDAREDLSASPAGPARSARNTCARRRGRKGDLEPGRRPHDEGIRSARCWLGKRIRRGAMERQGAYLLPAMARWCRRR
jgi:hypothetical protein